MLQQRAAVAPPWEKLPDADDGCASLSVDGNDVNSAELCRALYMATLGLMHRTAMLDRQDLQLL